MVPVNFMILSAFALISLAIREKPANLRASGNVVKKEAEAEKVAKLAELLDNPLGRSGYNPHPISEYVGTSILSVEDLQRSQNKSLDEAFQSQIKFFGENNGPGKQFVVNQERAPLFQVISSGPIGTVPKDTLVTAAGPEQGGWLPIEAAFLYRPESGTYDIEFSSGKLVMQSSLLKEADMRSKKRAAAVEKNMIGGLTEMIEQTLTQRTRQLKPWEPPMESQVLDAVNRTLPKKTDTLRSASTDQKQKILLMSDVDDTLTCPAVPRSKYNPSLASLAGSDKCPGMKHGQIYYGVGLFLYLLGTRGGASPELVIVSANPVASLNGYKHINEYMEKVSTHCNRKYGASGATLALTEGNVLKGDLKQSVAASAWGTYQRMGEYKLQQMVTKAKESPAKQIVWLGDTGQGDVCAAVCFLSPDMEDCPLKLSEETRQGLIDLGSIKKYAFLHYVTNPENAMLTMCFLAAEKYTKNIYFVGLPNSDRRWDYPSMIAQLCDDPNQELLDCRLDVNLQNDVDCLPDSEPKAYLKHGTPAKANLKAYLKQKLGVNTAGTLADTENLEMWRIAHVQ